MRDLGNPSFPWLRGREIAVAGQPVRALRVSYVGELGWELHPPIESLPALYDAVWDCGPQIRNRKLRTVCGQLPCAWRKAYKAWSSELTNELNMLEADMERFIDFDKRDFVGKAATLGAAPRPFKIVYAEVAAADTDARGGEPVLVADRCIGVVTSGAYGHRVRKESGIRLRRSAIRRAGSRFDVLIQGERRARDGAGRRGFRSGQSRMRV